jgi:hypothetical protein
MLLNCVKSNLFLLFTVALEPAAPPAAEAVPAAEAETIVPPIVDCLPSYIEKLVFRLCGVPALLPACYTSKFLATLAVLSSSAE